MDQNKLLYAASHEWVNFETQGSEKIATVGITDHAVELLTDLVYMELPKVGDTVTAGKSFGEVESVKATSDLFSPVNGEVIAVNDQLPNHLDWLSRDPFGEAWIIKVKVTADPPAGSLMNREAYTKQIAEHG